MDDNIIGPMHFAFGITKAANKHSECVIAYLLVFYGSSGYVNAPQRYIIPLLPLLLYTVLRILFVCVDVFFRVLKQKLMLIRCCMTTKK
jgi:hypothetical protein